MTRQPKVSLVHVTPDAEDKLLYIAKVSNPTKQHLPSPKLISYLIAHAHWSPFEMISLCVEIECPRDIGRQLLRHRSCKVQEFSQRYADVASLGSPFYRECRLQDPKNRQASTPTKDKALLWFWDKTQKIVWNLTSKLYHRALAWGIAREVARSILPEGLTPSRIYLHADLRSLIHLCHVRTEVGGAQKEIVDIARQLRELLSTHFPATYEAMVAWEKSLEK